jgi:hypothetical protein
MPETRWLVVALVGCLLLGVYTSFKLHRMTRIVDNDEIAVSKRVVQKTTEEGRRSTTCYFWAPERIQADCDYWESVNIGDRIDVVTVDDDQYVKGGSVYASKGNFVFDVVLLVAEILGVIVCVVLLVVRARRSSTARAASRRA